MKNKRLFLTVLFMIVSILGMTAFRTGVQPVQAARSGQEDKPNLEDVRDATGRFHNLAAAQAAGYHLVPGLDYCFNNPGVGGMGYHYINTNLLDTKVDALKPEALVFSRLKNGRLVFAAVEYIVPASAWDAEGHNQPPMLFGRSFHLNSALGVYALHAWIWVKNPLGIFEDWNPRVICP